MERKELDHVIYEKDGGIARIILNYPEKANMQKPRSSRTPPSQL